MENRDVVHLLHYIPVKVSTELYTIEDIIPLYEVTCSVRQQGKVQGVKVVPEGRTLDFKEKDEKIYFTVPIVEGHCMIEIQY
ncbi:MAG: hypothetical protein PHE02_14205 [Lachnospiraceae bacterium]|nr:hypothetical protein [Lachnospiraceae bacterium]